MRKRIKRILGVVMTICMVMGICMTVYASEEDPGIGSIVDGSVLTDKDTSEDILYNPARGNILNRGVARVSEIGSGQINAYGAVMGSVTCDTLRLEINVQQLQGSSWVNIRRFSDTASNTALLTKSYNCNVSKGYYYRVMAGCIATKGGTTETQIPVTNGIWID